MVCYGSSLSGLGFKNSDVNVDLQYPKDMKAPTVLLQVLNILNQSGWPGVDLEVFGGRR